MREKHIPFSFREKVLENENSRKAQGKLKYKNCCEP